MDWNSPCHLNCQLMMMGLRLRSTQLQWLWLTCQNARALNPWHQHLLENHFAYQTCILIFASVQSFQFKTTVLFRGVPLRTWYWFCFLLYLFVVFFQPHAKVWDEDISTLLQEVLRRPVQEKSIEDQSIGGYLPLVTCCWCYRDTGQHNGFKVLLCSPGFWNS